MRIGKLLSHAFLLLCLALTGAAQDKPTETDADKQKKKKEIDERVMQLLENAVGEADSLRLSQNKAVIYAMAGDLFWKLDEKRGRDLFRSAANEILAFNLENEKEIRDSNDAYADLFDYSSNVRGEILPLVAKHDAELALEMLLQTRPTRLTEAIHRMSLPNAKGSDMMGWNPDRQRVNQEVALEQQFALMAADENPDRAVKLIKDSLAKGVSMNVLALLQKLNRKDEKRATELGGEVLKKLGESDLTKNEDDLRAALNLLQYAFKPPTPTNPKEKQFIFSESHVKDLAGKVANAFLQPSRSVSLAMSLNMALPMLEKYAPEKTAGLRLRVSENDNTMPPEFKLQQQRQKLWDPNATPEELLASLPKLQGEYDKASAYEALKRKIAEIEDEARAKKLIDQIPDEKTKLAAQEQFEAARIGRSATAGKLDEARAMIGNLTKKKTQIQRLVAVATEFKKKGGEKDIENAKGLMKDARSFVNESAETEEEVADLMEVIKGYAVVDPAIGFKMYEPMIDMMNAYIQASSVSAKYHTRYSNFRKGELALKINTSTWEQPIFRYIPQVQLLGKADLDRMNTMAERFTRPDARVAVKLYVLQGFLKDDKKPEDPKPNQGGMIYFY